jgi:hypothetical protein
MEGKQYDNTNSGILFRNDRKKTDKQPDHTGTLNVDGKDWWISAWVRTSRDGKKFFSLAVTLKEPKPVETPKTDEEVAEGIPF